MSQRRWIIALSLLAILLVGAEVTLRRWQNPKACIQIINEGDGVMEDLVLDYAGSKIPVGRLAMKTSIHVWVTAGPKGILRLDFRQKGNALKGFQIPEFDPRQNLEDFFKQVLVVKTNEIQRYVEDDEFRKKPESWGERVKQWMSSELRRSHDGLPTEPLRRTTAMRETTRTFIAIPIPEPIGLKLGRKQAELTPAVPGCRWTAGSPFHLTLAFLGDVRNRDLNELCRAVAGAAEPFERFELRLEGLGAFPSPQKSRVVWAGVTAPDLHPLLDLRQAIVQASTQAGYRPDDLRFHPHITLGRIKSDRGHACDLTEIVDREQTWSAGTFTSVEVVTYASTLDPKGPSYAPLGRVRLAGTKSTRRA